jgi:CRISPR-associated endoribonuclease Cas6
MPHSIVVQLQPETAISQKYLTGRHIHALFLDLVTATNPKLGTLLHDQENNKAFTLSLLQSNSRSRDRLQWEHRESLPADKLCWWRITLLDDRLFGQLANLWLNINTEKAWYLGGTNLQVISIFSSRRSPHNWSDRKTYQDLYDDASSEERQIHFSFYTPTAFREGKYDTALPTAKLVFNSLVKRWNQYSDHPFDPEIILCLYPSFFTLGTEILQDGRSKFIGSIGHISFKILGDIDPEKIKQINTLADFAFYAGIGKKTPMGMGIVKRQLSNMVE